MKEIVVISGKGGTGKTSLAASFASLAKNECVVADCDVDAANMHLLLNADFKIKEDFFSGKVAFIDDEACRLCGKCQNICRFGAISYAEGAYKVDPVTCEGCHYCEEICRVNAIEMISQKTGSLFISNIKTGTTMVHAKLGFGAENSGKLVAKVKKEAREIAIKEDISYILVDGSPGIGCPVVSSLSGASLVVLVTEATISGLHDLKRVHQLLKTFGLKSVCIINKYDLNEEISFEIEKYLDKSQILLIAKLPYDESFAKAMGEGRAIVEYMDNELSDLVKKSWNTIKEKI